MALHFCIHTHEDIPTCLFSAATKDNLVKTIKGITEKLTEEELECLEEVLEKFFRPIKNVTWANPEPDKYREKL